MYNKLKIILRNPLVSIAIAILISSIFYYLSTKKSEVSYAVTLPTTVYSASTSDSDLEFKWQNRKIDNSILQVKLPIWNSGDDYIDFERFSTTYPTTFTFPDNIEIIDALIQTKSREDLAISLSRDENKIALTFIGDDALEQKDGILISILYLSESEGVKPEPIIGGRVKGLSSGEITKGTWAISTDSVPMSAMFSILFIFILVGSVLLMNLNRYFISTPYLGTFLYVFLIPSMAIGCFIVAGLTAMIIITDFSLAVPWYK